MVVANGFDTAIGFAGGFFNPFGLSGLGLDSF
jgi:hypothetical protein